MPEPWNTALAVIASLGGGGTIVFAFSSWLGKVWASRILAVEKHELEMLRNEHSVKFSKLHEEQARVVKELYSKLLEIKNACSLIVRFFEHDKKGVQTAKDELSKELFEHSKSDEFRKFYKENEILFPDSICDLIQEIYESDSMIWFHAATDIASEGKDALETAKDLEKKIGIALEKVKKEFRILLGVKE